MFYFNVKGIVTFLLLVLLASQLIGLQAQTLSSQVQLFSSMKTDGGFPATLLSTRAAVFYDEIISETERQTIQKAFQQAGIDAITYLEISRTLAGVDCQRTSFKYLVKRNIVFLIFLRKAQNEYEFYFTSFNNKPDLIDKSQPAWFIHESGLKKALNMIYQMAIAAEKKQNFLINDQPEYITEKEASPIVGRRNETLTTDIGYFSVAFPKFGDQAADKELEIFLKENYSGKYELVDGNADESDLRKKGFLFILRFVHAKGSLAKDVLDYESTKSASAIASATFTNGELQLKAIPAEEEVYKFYFKKLETGEVFLGKWDADILWQDALKNHIHAYKAEKKLK